MWWKKKPMVQPDPLAKKAREDALQDLQRRLDDTSRVQAMTAEWRRIREKNHFAAAINATFRGGA